MVFKKLVLTAAYIFVPALVIAQFKFTIVSTVLAPLAIASFPLIREDFRSKRLPNRIIYPTTLATLGVVSIYAIQQRSFSIFTQLVSRAGIAFLIALILYFIARGGFGAGDVKLVFLAVLTLGIFTPAHILAAAIFACLGVALYSLALLVTKQASTKSTVAFGPFIILGSWLSILLFN